MPRLNVSGKTAPVRQAKAPRVRAAAAPRVAAPRVAAPKPRLAAPKRPSPFRAVGNPKAAAKGAAVSRKRTPGTARSGDFVATGKLNARQVSDTRVRTAAATPRLKTLAKRQAVGPAYTGGNRSGRRVYVADDRVERPAPYDASSSSRELTGSDAATSPDSQGLAGSKGRARPRKSVVRSTKKGAGVKRKRKT